MSDLPYFTEQHLPSRIVSAFARDEVAPVARASRHGRGSSRGRT